MGEEAAATTGVETDTGDTGADNTLLTGDIGAADGGTETGSDAGAADAGSTDDAGAVEGTGDAGEEGSQMPPDTYADFVMPEGVTVDETLLAEAVPLFKEMGLTQEQAQKLVDFQAKQVQAGSQKQVDAFNQLMSDWREQSKNDSEFGGEKFEENVKVAQAAISAYGTPELKQLLEDHGVGNHPEVVRFMVRVGRTLKEDVPGSTGAVTSPAADHVSILYPSKEK